MKGWFLQALPSSLNDPLADLIPTSLSFHLLFHYSLSTVIISITHWTSSSTSLLLLLYITMHHVSPESF